MYAAKIFARISLVPINLLWPIVFALSVIGAYALNSSLLDIWIVLIFGVIGFFARRFGFAVAPIAVGLILGKMVEVNLAKGNAMRMRTAHDTAVQPRCLAQQFANLQIGVSFRGRWGGRE